MRTTWHVARVTSTPNRTVAELQRVEWFKKNPAWDTDDEAVEEFIDAEPGEHTAEFIEADGTMSLEVTDGLDLRAGDNVYVTVTVAERVPA